MSLLARAARSLLGQAGCSPACLASAHGGASAAAGAPAAAAAARQQQQQRRAMSIVVNVRKNNVDQAMQQLNRRAREAGLPQELRKRDHRVSAPEAKFAAARSRFNAGMGHLIRERLKWIMRRRNARSV